LSVPTIASAPDFYTYGPSPISQAELARPNRIECRWPDGMAGVFNGTWLRENSMGHGIDPVTREGIADPAELLRHTVVAAGLEHGELVVTWSDHLRCSYSSGWLRSVAAGEQRMSAGLPIATPWVTTDAPSTIQGERRVDLPTIAWPTSPTSEVLLDLTTDLLRYGAVRLTGGPVGVDDLEGFAVHLGPLRETNFGRVWDVVAKVDPDSTAYTGRSLVPHTDLPSRERPPGFQALHCIANTCSGGLNQMSDGLAIVNHLATAEPEHHQALTMLRWVFMSKGSTIDHRWSAPVVETEPADGSLIIRGFSPVRAFPDMPPDEVERSYAAIARLHELGADPAFQIESAFEPGDAVIFDNRRMLHARSAFDPEICSRHLRGCYLDHDDVRSVARVLLRRTSRTTSELTTS
jgi:gamma-butyrobetaine dioxygenase